MKDDPPNRPELRLVVGGRERRLCGVRVEVASAERAPFSVDAVAIEDDTYSVLSADPTVSESADHPIRIWTGLKDIVEAGPGNVIVKHGRPIKLLAVVHDLSSEPTWMEEWISAALDGIFDQIRTRRLKSLGLPPLGSVHGKLRPERFVELLRDSLEREPPETLERIWIVAPERFVRRLETSIDAT